MHGDVALFGAAYPRQIQSVAERVMLQPVMVQVESSHDSSTILGALTGENGIAGNQVGKVQIFANRAYVAVSRSAAKVAFGKLGAGKMKGRSFRVRMIQD